MDNTLMIEIDDATRGIMLDLQASIANTIEQGVSGSLNRLSSDSASQLADLKGTLSDKLLFIGDEVSDLKKPIKYLSKDIDEVQDILHKVQNVLETSAASYKEEQEAFEQQFKTQLQEVTAHIVAHQQATVKQMMEYLVNEAEKQVAASESIRDEEKEVFEKAVKELVAKQEQQTNHIMTELSNTKTELQFLQQRTDEAVQNQKKLIEAAHIKSKQHVNEIAELTQQKLDTKLDQASLLAKLDDLTKQVEYANLPFYKKWFSKRGK